MELKNPQASASFYRPPPSDMVQGTPPWPEFTGRARLVVCHHPSGRRPRRARRDRPASPVSTGLTSSAMTQKGLLRALEAAVTGFASGGGGQGGGGGHFYSGRVPFC